MSPDERAARIWAAVNRVSGRAGGWLYLEGDERPITQGWTALARDLVRYGVVADGRVLCQLPPGYASVARFIDRLRWDRVNRAEAASARRAAARSHRSLFATPWN